MIEGNYLSVLFWSSLIGIGLRQSSVATKDVIANLSTGITTVVQMIIGIAPIGILGLVFHSVATTGIAGLAKYGQLLLLLIGTMAVVALVVYPAIVFWNIRQNPYPLVFFVLKESAIPAFFTRSSAANIPINMELAKAMDLNEESYAVSIPLGATINMGGGHYDYYYDIGGSPHIRHVRTNLFSIIVEHHRRCFCLWGFRNCWWLLVVNSACM